MLQVRCVGATDIGQKRKSNQDQFLIARLTKSVIVDQSSIAADHQTLVSSDAEGQLLVVADGMGGHAGGEVASELAIDSAVAYILNIVPWFHRLRYDCDEDFKEELKDALEFCQRQLGAKADAKPELHAMGTTLTMAYIIGRQLYVVHVGDSRCYLLRDGELIQITCDHTVAQMLLEQGELSKEASASSPLGNVLWNAIGGSDASDLRPDAIKCELRDSDTLLLCTDGLTRYLDNAALQSMLHRDVDLRQQCEALVAAANSAGGADNITVVLARISDVEIKKNVHGAGIASVHVETSTAELADTDIHIPIPEN